MSEIGDLIFDSNSTLFNVLDTLEVPQLSADLTTISVRVQDLSEQTIELGRIVDNNRLDANTKFVDVNTRIDNLDFDFSALTTEIDVIDNRVSGVEVKNQELDSSVRSLTEDVNQNRVDISNLVSRVNTLDTRVTSISGDVLNLSSQVFRLESSINSLQVSVANLTTTSSTLSTRVGAVESRTTSLENTFGSIPISYRNLYYSNAYLVPNVSYTVINQQANNYWERTITLNPLSGNASLRMGAELSGALGGVTYNYIVFWDSVASSPNRQGGMIPVGGPIALRYGTRSTSGTLSFTNAFVRITKQFLI